jgi:hypothetical protein
VVVVVVVVVASLPFSTMGLVGTTAAFIGTSKTRHSESEFGFWSFRGTLLNCGTNGFGAAAMLNCERELTVSEFSVMVQKNFAEDPEAVWLYVVNG